MSKMDQLSLVKKISWEEAFDIWRINEGDREEWQNVAVTQKGWSNWEEWRRYSASRVGLENLEWNLYEVKNPMDTIPSFLVGPFRGWQGQIPEEMRNKISFGQFVQERQDWVKNHGKITGIGKDFPNKTQLMGLYLEDRDEIMCFEGSHRCSAVSLAKLEGKTIDFKTKPLIAVATISGDSLKLMNQVLEMSSEKPGFEPK